MRENVSRTSENRFTGKSASWFQVRDGFDCQTCFPATYSVFSTSAFSHSLLFLFCRSISFLYVFRDFFFFPFNILTPFTSSPLFPHQVLFLFLSRTPRLWYTGIQPRKVIWLLGLGTRGTQRPCQHHLPEELNRKREALQLPLNPASASMRTLSHPIVKNWPETKGRQADKYSRLGLGKSWGFLYAHVTFEAVFRSLIPLAIWHICSLCFSFLVFFFFWSEILAFLPGRKEQEGFRHCWEAWGGKRHQHLYRPSTPLGTGSWPHSQTTKGQRGESRCGPWAPGANGLLGPTPPFKTFREEWLSVKQISEGIAFTNTPLISLGKLREIAKDGKPGVLQSMGSQRVGHDWVIDKHSFFWPASGVLCGSTGHQTGFDWMSPLLVQYSTLM